MKLAITFENGQVFQHFGQSKAFKIYDITDDGKTVAESILEVQGEGHGSLAKLLDDNGVNVLICGGIGGGARETLEKVGIDFYPGVTGSADEAKEAFLNNQLNYDPDTTCNHHGHHHHEHEHSN